MKVGDRCRVQLKSRGMFGEVTKVNKKTALVKLDAPTIRIFDSPFRPGTIKLAISRIKLV